MRYGYVAETCHYRRREKRRTGEEKERRDYAFRREFNEKPSITPGCPGNLSLSISLADAYLLGLQDMQC